MFTDTIPSLVALIPVENSEVSQAACLALANLTYQSLNNSLLVLLTYLFLFFCKLIKF